MNRQKISQAELLNALPFMEGYSKAGAEEFLSQSVYSRIPKGKIISTEGDSCSNFSFVLNGSIKVYKLQITEGRLHFTI